MKTEDRKYAFPGKEEAAEKEHGGEDRTYIFGEDEKEGKANLGKKPFSAEGEEIEIEETEEFEELEEDEEDEEDEELEEGEEEEDLEEFEEEEDEALNDEKLKGIESENAEFTHPGSLRKPTKEDHADE